jgi:hypothetical protein
MFSPFFKKGGSLGIFKCSIQHCFICRPGDSTVLEDAGIEPRTVEVTLALAVRWSNHSARAHPYYGSTILVFFTFIKIRVLNFFAILCTLACKVCNMMQNPI